MKLVIFGANGGIGHNLVEQGLAEGHDVTAVARRPEMITAKSPKLRIEQGDVLRPTTLTSAISGCDAVLSAIGSNSREPTVLYSQGIANIIQAMDSLGVRRLLCVSASGLDPGHPLQRWVAKPLLWLILKNMYTDLVRMENEVKASDLDWTIIRPPQLTAGAFTGQYKSAINQHLMQAWKISRADTAGYMLTQLKNPTSYRAIVEIAN